MVRFVNPDNPKSKWEMPPGFIGEVPGWVEKHWYFDALCKDGTITVIKGKSDRDIQSALDNAPSGGDNAPSGEAANPSAEQGNVEGETTDGNDTAKTDGKKGNGGKK